MKNQKDFSLSATELLVLQASGINCRPKELDPIIIVPIGSIYTARKVIQAMMGKGVTFHTAVLQAYVLGLIPREYVLPYVADELIKVYAPHLLDEKLAMPLPDWYLIRQKHFS